MPSENYYDLFGLDPSANDEQIRAAYKQLASEHHPDRSNTPESAAKFKAASDAYHILKDESRRAKYDRLLVRVQERVHRNTQRRSPSTTTSRTTAFRTRTTPPAAPIDPVEKARREKAVRELERWIASLSNDRNSAIDWMPILSRVGALAITAYFAYDWQNRGRVFAETRTVGGMHDRLLLVILMALLTAGLLLVFRSGSIAEHDHRKKDPVKHRIDESFYWQSGWMLLLAAPFLVNLVRSFIVG
ncbi:J domain-containing protein [Lacunimicrobium album]